MKIRNLEFSPPIFLAPMAGVTDRSFRLLARQMGCPLTFGEMVSAKGIHYKSERTVAMLRTTPEERPVALQLFGSEPDIVEEAARFVTAMGTADIIDFNLGCPAPKIVNNGEGSALMKNPLLVGKLIAALRRGTNLPVTVKIRAGFDAAHINAAEIAKVAEDAGADAVAVHGRTREQFYSGNADWRVIADVKANVSIPVIGNGDIRSAHDMERMFAETKCNGIMIGRGAQGNPWLFRELNHFYVHHELLPPPTFAERKDIMLRHLDMLIADKGEYIGIREMRRHAAYYTRALVGGARLREKFNSAESVNDFIKILNDYQDAL